MHKISSSELRNRFVDYFKSNGHTSVASSSLIPENDPTLLFANAGMNQFKNLFLGLEKRDYTRAVSVQKCVRAGGKHNDLENVGFTARHHTFFEMLGNFSFGDYFKKDAIHFAWEFLTHNLGIPKDRLFVTVFKDDDESADIWHKQEGIPKDRIFRFGEKDNFWRMGETGPCGPCTEIFYNHGDILKPDQAFKSIAAGEDRIIEIWNLVLMQYFESAPGKLEPLPKPSVDTGAGLERISALLQGETNNYNSDLFSPMIERAAKAAKLDLHKLIDLEKSHSKEHKPETLAALRVLADHSRATGFLIADGALPSNEGRGYVLRRIMRRAIRYGKKLNPDQSFLLPMIEVLAEQMGAFYPELKQRRDVILNNVKEEETRFSHTLDQGTQILNEEIANLKKQGNKTLDGDLVFKLYDTFGFPADLTRVMAAEQGVLVDETQFEKQMEAARAKAKASWKGKGIQSDEAHIVALSNEVFNTHGATQFLGYDSLSSESSILALSDGTKKLSSLAQGQTGLLITLATPFYAEGGGQIGDMGKMGSSAAKLKVTNTTKTHDVFIHHVEVESGNITANSNLTLQVTESLRRQTANNHSATHLLHAALRKALGEHVTQAGSLVDATKLRFDYTHNKPMTLDELKAVEDLVNGEISKGLDVKPAVMSQKEALAQGAIALFGEKYGDQVRVIKMGQFSTELCGGTHVKNTSQIRLFKIVSEAGVSAGIRRIEALTGDNAFKFLSIAYNEYMRARTAIASTESWTSFFEGASSGVITDWIENKKTEIKSLEKEVKKLKGSSVDIDSIVAQAQSFTAKSGQAKLATADVDIDDRELLAQITDQIKNKIQSGVVIVVGKGEQSHPIIVATTKDISTQFSAGNILKELAAIMGGKGGGRPDFAQGSTPDRSKLQEAFIKARGLLG